MNGLISKDRDIIEYSDFKGIFNLSYNGQKLSTPFQISIFTNRLEIMVENSNDSSKENAFISTIYFNYLESALYNSSNESLQLTFSPECKLWLFQNKCVDITNLSIHNTSSLGLTPFNTFLFKSLLLTKDLINFSEIFAYINTHIKINNESSIRCKCFVIKHELFMSSPLDLKFDLSIAEQVTLSNDKTIIVITLPNYDIQIKLKEAGQLLYNFLDEISKIPLLSLNDEITIAKLDELIKFITTYGLKSEGVFRHCGTQQNIGRLFSLVLKSQQIAKIKPSEFTVNDVTSFLKKCIQSHLNGSLIPDNVFQKLKSVSDIKDEKLLKGTLKAALKELPEINYKILRRICELLYMIVDMTEFNLMTSDNLATSSAMSFISKELSNLQESTFILRAFIDHFIFVFEYSVEEQRRLNLVLEKMKTNPSQFTVRRPFLFTSSLRAMLQLTVEESPTKIDKEDSFVIGSMCIDQNGTIGSMLSEIFTSGSQSNVVLWHFVSTKRRWIKRLLYANDAMDSTIINGWEYPDKINNGTGDSFFIFREKNDDDNVKSVGASYQCQVKVDNPKDGVTALMLVMTMPNSMQCFDTRNENEVYFFRLSELKLYRGHNTNSLGIYLIQEENTVLSWTFSKAMDYKEFLFYYDKFRLRRTIESKL